MATPSVLQWKREYLLTVGDSKNGRKALVVKDHRLSFEITKTIGATPNVADIRIFNLSPDDEGLIRGEADEVILNAGYKDHSLLIFAGQIRSVFRPREENDWVTTIHAADGDGDLRDTIVNASFVAGTSTSDLIDHLIGKMSRTTRGHMVFKERSRIRGRVLTGQARHVFDKLANESDAHWSIQDGELVMVPVDSTLPTEAVVLRSDTGLIGTPELDDKGIRVRCLMNPMLRVNGKVKLDNNELKAKIAKLRSAQPGAKTHKAKVKELARLDPDGIYKIYEVKHSGDTRADIWWSDIKCVGLDKPIPAGPKAA